MNRRFLLGVLAAVGLLGPIETGCNQLTSASSRVAQGIPASTAANTSPSTSSTTAATTSTTLGSPAPTTSGTLAVSGTPAVTQVSLVSAVWSGTGYAATQGDTIRITLSQEVVVFPAANPTDDLVLPVQGNSFGAGATLASGTSPTELVVTLGSMPDLRISGTFGVADTTSGSSSGIDFPGTPTGHIVTPSGGLPVNGPVDLGGSLTEGWTVAASLQVPRGEHTATLLDDGRILVVGGEMPIANVVTSTPATIPWPVIDAEIYDPVANTFTKTTDPSLGGPAGDMLVPVAGLPGQVFAVGRALHTATRLQDGRVLIAGGFGFERPNQTPTGAPLEEVASCHVFDPSTNTFTETATPLTTARQRHTATLLPNGWVIIAGGVNSNMPFGNPPVGLQLSLRSAEIYDPVTNGIAPVSSSGLDMVEPRMDEIAAYDRTYDQVLYSGGAMRLPPQAPPPGSPPPKQSLFRVPGGAEAFGVTSGIFEATLSSPTENVRYQATATDANGVIWILGGNDDQALAASALVETYSGGAFAAVGTLSVARARAQADVLGDRLVVVAGGTTYALAPGDECANVDLVDTDAQAVLPAPSMHAARNSLSLTTVGPRVFAIGGFNGSAGTPTSTDGVPVAFAEFYCRP